MKYAVRTVWREHQALAWGPGWAAKALVAFSGGCESWRVGSWLHWASLLGPGHPHCVHGMELQREAGPRTLLPVARAAPPLDGTERRVCLH